MPSQKRGSLKSEAPIAKSRKAALLSHHQVVFKEKEDPKNEDDDEKNRTLQKQELMKQLQMLEKEETIFNLQKEKRGLTEKLRHAKDVKYEKNMVEKQENISRLESELESIRDSKEKEVEDLEHRIKEVQLQLQDLGKS